MKRARKYGQGTMATIAVLCVFLLLYFPEHGECRDGVPAKRQWVGASWENTYDGDLTFTCPGENQAISGLYSQHNNAFEDRQFMFECSDLPGNTQGSTWNSNYQNDYDMELNFLCPFNSVMIGMQSHHNNDKEDRRWSFTCMQVPVYRLADCVWTDYNDLDADIEVPTLDNYFFTGARSQHHDHAEDRNWSYQRCKLKQTACTMARHTAVAVFVLCVFLLLPANVAPVAGPWVNGYHRWFGFSCDHRNQFISGLFSRHDNGWEDRRFKIECRNLTITPEQYGSTFESGYLNEYDAEVDFECPSHGVLRGVQSAHSDWHMDRNWNFICMEVRGFCWYGCTWSAYNDWDDDVDIPTADWHFITGARSHHEDRYEDRKWSYQRCGLRAC
ncbi:uncharacterized protein LOC144909819 [Branchiostoma floridae x Branchiostoma belcheri]